MWAVTIQTGCSGVQHLKALAVDHAHDGGLRVLLNADLVITADDLQIEPTVFRPGDQLTLTVTIRNIGTDGARAHVWLRPGPDCGDIGGPVLAEFESEVPAGGAKTWRSHVIAGEWDNWHLSATAELLSPFQLIRKAEVTTYNNHAEKPFGNRKPKPCGFVIP